MIIIAGLGNPGGQYAKNRHNIGFMAADAIADENRFSPWSKKFKGLISEGELAGEKALLIKPQTFMNLSGESVGEAMRFFKLTPADLIVVYDELDLMPGKARIKTGGGSGGHNGIKSIDAHCGKDYRRLRLGIGHPGMKEKVHGHVLGDFAKADADWLEPLLEALGRNADLLAKGDDSQLMNKLALATGGKSPAPPENAQRSASPKKPKAQSHIHKARQNGHSKMPETGPMADMLKKMFGQKKD
ncbi:aminoacyl-tRNA hydrolase [Martelella mediterranea]|uniref:Peptidyl-tRNA hydrolase n=1 Tax=Martelella mediterranea TaxID=293089 RepID=A0A4R3P1C6_9HYPH|nr:aminoacyl-tRNA hydrolase [Martelella mediterranea]TCT40191.1 peptidyl-tRNA hydrolase [Martelella mediterranea]